VTGLNGIRLLDSPIAPATLLETRAVVFENRAQDSSCRRAAARSPITTQGAIVLPVVRHLIISVSTGLFPGGTPLGVRTLQTTHPIAHPRNVLLVLKLKFYTKIFTV